MDGYILHGTDAPESLRAGLVAGNNVNIMLEPDTRADADRLFKALSAGGKADMPLQVMFWGDYYGQLTDKFGIPWMINCSGKS